jgi:hypothetical protein
MTGIQGKRVSKRVATYLRVSTTEPLARQPSPWPATKQRSFFALCFGLHPLYQRDQTRVAKESELRPA